MRPILRQGTCLRDTYTVDALLGSGAFADTYLVRHRFMGMQAMKVLIAGTADESLELGLGEAFLLSRISHEGIVRVFDANQIELDGKCFPYLTMEYVPHGTLADVLRKCEGGIQTPAAVDVALQVARALGHAHQQEPSIVHRDVKPANILVRMVDDGHISVQLADFGLACRVNRFTEVAEATGTVMYMSPESLRGYEVPASDVYAAGLVFYQLLTGTMPYPACTLREAGSVKGLQSALQGAQSQPVRPPSYFDGDIPSDVDAVALRALEHDERRRFNSGAEFVEALLACQEARDVPPIAQGDLQAATALASARAAMSLAGQSSTMPQAVAKLTGALQRWPQLEVAFGPHLKWMRLQEQRAEQCS